jgi:hypothetical protein
MIDPSTESSRSRGFLAAACPSGNLLVFDEGLCGGCGYLSAFARSTTNTRTFCFSDFTVSPV